MKMAADLLLETMLRGALLGAGALLAHYVLRRRFSAAVCHRLLVCALAALALMPVFIVCCDGWAVLPPLRTAAAQAESAPLVPVPLLGRPVTAPADPEPRSPALPSPQIHKEASVSPALPTVTAPAVVPPVASASTPAVIASPRIWPSWRTWLVGIWALGTLVLMAGMGREIMRLRRLRREASKVEDAALRDAAQACAKAIGLRRLPRIGFMNHEDGPLVAGFLRPSVVLPSLFSSWPDERCRAVLLHEMAHVKRRDALVQLCAALVCAVHWFNPFAWLLLWRLRHEAERACDDVVLGGPMAAANYADHLLAVASGGRTASSLAPSMAQPSGLRQRVHSVLSTTVRRGAVSRVTGFVVLALAAALSLPVMLAQTAEPKPPPKPAQPAGATTPKSPKLAPPAADAPTKSPKPVTAAAAAANPGATRVAVSVQTLDAVSKPLGGVMLRGFRTNKQGPITPFAPEFAATTDDQGQWAAELPFGEYTVLATKGNLVATPGNNQTWWYLNKKNLKEDLKLKLVEGGKAQITVIDSVTFHPVPGAKLIMDCGHSQIADAFGRATFTALPIGERVLKVVSPPYADAHVDFNSTGQPETIVEARLNAGFELRGRVTNGAGLPVKGAVVEDNYSGQTFLVQMNVCATDAEGNYALGWYPKSRPLWSISVAHKDYAEQSKSELGPPAEGDTTRCDFVLDTGLEIAGVVKDGSGNPIKGASVRYGSDWALIGMRSARSDGDGKFRITKIGRQELREIVVEAAGYAPAWDRAKPGKDADVPQLDFTLAKGLTVKGRLVDKEGNPVTGVTISPRAQIGGGSVYVGGRIGVDAQGNFQITSLPATGTALDAYGAGVSDVRNLKFDPTQPLVVTMEKPGVIIGRVLDAETRQPVKAFNVRLDHPRGGKEPGEPSSSYSSHLSERGQNCTSDEGRFVVEELITRAGHAVIVSAEGYTDCRVERVVARPASDPAWPQEFLMDHGTLLLGKVTDAVSGDPVGGARVYLLAKRKWYSTPVYTNQLADLQRSSAYGDVTMARTNASGAVEVHLPTAAKFYSAVVVAPGHAPVLLEEQSAANANLAVPPLPREAKVRGTAAGLPGVDFSSDTVSITGSQFCVDRVKLAADGSFEAGGLVPGKAFVSVLDAQGMTRGSATLDLVAGETNAINFAVQAPASVKAIVTRGAVPVEGADVCLIVRWGERVVGTVGRGKTGKDGTVLIQNLPAMPGTLFCFANRAGGRQAQSQPVDLSYTGQSPEIHFDLDAKDARDPTKRNILIPSSKLLTDPEPVRGNAK